MAEKATHIRLRWLTPEGATEPVSVSVRSVSERGAFAMLATAHGPGTRGTYELLDAEGKLIREGSCRILFQKRGAGIGLALLERPPLRRSSRPPLEPYVGTRSGPPPAPAKPLEEAVAKPPSPLAPSSSQEGAPPKAPAAPSSQEEEAPPSEERDAPEQILGSRPPRAPRRRVKTVQGIGTQPPSEPEPPSTSTPAQEQEGFVPVESLATAPTEAPAPSHVQLDGELSDEPSGASAADQPPEPADPSLDALPGLDTPPAELVRARAGSVPDLEVPLGELADPAISDKLPELPRWEPPPPSPPPPRFDPGSWEPPTYEPALMSDEPVMFRDGAPVHSEAGTEAPRDPPEAPADDAPTGKHVASPRPSIPSMSAPPPSTSSRAPSAAPSRPPPPPSAAKTSGRAARVATRVAGSGARGLAIGIDLGTSNTCASAVIDGVPQVIPTRFGTNTVPSVLTVIDSRVVVGHAAAKRMVMNPHETIYGSKRLVGRAYTEELADEYQPSFAYPLVETEDHRFGASLRGRVISFEQVAEYLLAEVRDVAEAHLQQRVHGAVITVPAYFGEAQREAVRRAARGARLNVDRLVPEPTAAAIAYGYDAQEEHTLVVFDLGGGTFDVSVLRVGGNRFEVLATGGDAFLGGIDVDDLIAGFLLEEFQRVERTTLEPSPQQLARLRDAAEDAKRDLSMQARVAISLPHFARIDDEPRELRATIGRDKLDELASGFVDRLIAITAATLADCRIAAHDVDDILLVGGMTRMALIPEKVEAYFGRRPSRRINPDEAVALGAARLAESSGKVELLDVLPLSIGVAGQGRRFQRLLPRNTRVPMERSFTLRTRFDDQEELRIPLFQGERSDAAANEYLGTLMVEEIPRGKKGAELELFFSLDEQCYLEVRAAHVASGRGLAVYVNREEGAEKAIERLEKYTGPQQEKEAPPRRGLGRFFGKLRSLFGRKS